MEMKETNLQGRDDFLFIQLCVRTYGQCTKVFENMFRRGSNKHRASSGLVMDYTSKTVIFHGMERGVASRGCHR